MRIIRGKYKTRYYPVPKNFPSRPTTDFAKEGLFNIIEHQYSLENLKILDLCSGTGSISIEFLSREAGSVVAVDKNFNCIKHLKGISEKLGCKDQIQIVKSDIIKYLSNTEDSYDMIFADPPFNFEDYGKLVDLIFKRKLLNEQGVIIIEHAKQTSLEDITHFQFSRTYGNVSFSFFELEQ